MSIEATSSLSPSTSMARTINPGLGTLGALPREIRDEIYRNLVVGDYTMSSWDLQYFVSKFIHDEATSMIYSRSFFRRYIETALCFQNDRPLPSCNDMIRMELIVDRFPWSSQQYRDYRDYGEFFPEIESNLTVILDRSTGLGRLHNTVLVYFELGRQDIYEALFSLDFSRLKALFGSRTVIMDVGADFINSDDCAGGPDPNYEERSKRIARSLEQEMVPAMGPTIVRYSDENVCLEFYPLEHMQGNLGAQAEIMQIKSVRMEKGAGVLEG